MKIASWNVNGIRSCLRDRPGGGLEDWLLREGIGLACLQEVKAGPEILDSLAGGLTGLAGYTPYWHCAEKPGYSGTAVLAAPGVEIVDVRYGMGAPDIDREGRVMMVELADFRLVNLYAPTASGNWDDWNSSWISAGLLTITLRHCGQKESRCCSPGT